MEAAKAETAPRKRPHRAPGKAPEMPVIDRSKPVSMMTRGERVIAFIEEFCRVPEGKKVGQRVELAWFQILFILAIYDNPRCLTHTAILCMARKNGKTGLIAMLLLAHICGPEAVTNSQIISGAMSREQASLVFKYARKVIALDKRLKALCHIIPSQKMIIGLARNVEYHAISAEATTAYGLSPILAILDEMGQVVGPTSAFVEAITTSQGAYDNPLLIVISTSAASDADMLSLWIDDAENDPGAVVHEYRAEKDCDLMDRTAWEASNPALGIFRSESDLEKQLRKASRLPSLENGARNLLLNQRTSLVSRWLAPTPWKDCAGDIDRAAFTSGAVVSCGLDLSQRLDLTAAVLAVRDRDRIVHLLPYVFTPLQGVEERAARDRAPYDAWVRDGWLIAVPGHSVDYDYVAQFMALECERLGINIDVLAFDRWRIKQFRASAEVAGFAQSAQWVEVGQGYKDFTPRMTAFEHLILSGKMRHGAHPLLNMAAANAISTRDPAGNTKLDKSKSTQRIDPLVAAVMAVFEVSEGAESPFDVAAMVG